MEKPYIYMHIYPFPNGLLMNLLEDKDKERVNIYKSVYNHHYNSYVLT